MEQLKVIRQFYKKSQWELSKQTGIAQSKISLFENGYVKPRRDELVRLSSALGVEVKQLLNQQL